MCGTTTGGYMGWESPGGTTHFAPPTFHYEAAYSPLIPSSSDPHHPTPLCSSQLEGRGQQQQPHTVHFHVQPGEAVSLQLGEQVQTIQVITYDETEMLFIRIRWMRRLKIQVNVVVPKLIQLSVIC